MNKRFWKINKADFENREKNWLVIVIGESNTNDLVEQIILPDDLNNPVPALIPFKQGFVKNSNNIYYRFYKEGLFQGKKVLIANSDTLFALCLASNPLLVPTKNLFGRQFFRGNDLDEIKASRDGIRLDEIANGHVHHPIRIEHWLTSYLTATNQRDSNLVVLGPVCPPAWLPSWSS